MRPVHLRPSTSRRTRTARGFSLISVLVAIVLFAVGLLGMLRAYVTVTSTGTQNQYLSAMASASNGFWGVVQTNPGIITGMAGSYTAATIGTAPALLQPWLTKTTNDIPGATVVIATSADASTGAVCSATGCTVKLTLTWTPRGSPYGSASAATARSQSFYYQFGF